MPKKHKKHHNHQKTDSVKNTKQQRYVQVASGLLIVAALVVFAYFVWRGGNSQPLTDAVQEDVGKNDEKKESTCEFRRPLDGICVASQKDRFPRLVAIMIENHPDARPQSALASASVVYEAPVEGGITRFLALFPVDTQVEKAGPVRSARSYYLDWVSEYGNPMYMHVGGSNEALTQVRTYDMFDFDQFYRDWFYWRSSDRYAPHNVYTKTALWKQGWNEYGKDFDAGSYAGHVFDDGVDVCETACTQKIVVDFSTPSFRVSWNFDAEKKQYIRSLSGKLHKDQDGTQITADTIVVQKVASAVLDNKGRLHIDTIGTGDVTVFRNGNMIEGTWTKKSRTEPTTFLDDQGNDISLKSGKIWIEIVNERGSVNAE